MIHPTAVIQQGAEIDDEVEIGPYCVIGDKVKIGAGTKISGHVSIDGRTEIGRSCTIHPFVSIGSPPQDITYKGEDTTCIVGDRNVIREYVTINCGSAKATGTTRVGSNNFIMAYSHIGHDCVVGSNIIMANCATLAGHVHVDDFAYVGGLSAVHQFCKVGKHSFISGLTGIPRDVPPFVMAAGNRARLYGLNVVGLERRGFSKDDITKLKRAYRLLFRSSLSLEAALKMITEQLDGEHIEELVTFIRGSERGICR
ncbi:MAG: Acyl-(acyl-carrier-protein)--UDP-N-acetylglucosamine O-acyltransferase [Syntrophorhabdaceae bacterium PtaU1.Bin034]|nr:MAG: Acyl-(acyl-carrier-protein)--UDP-N-acetylglucosamine O-acyltransferase [Syntrophorhabdaceae bacterium PtaU1.Bin034]